MTASRSRLLRWLVAAPLFGVAAAAAWSALPVPVAVAALEERELVREACLNRFEGFGKTVSWYSAGNAVRIDAALACASRRGSVYELSDVTLEVRSKKGTWTRIRTPRATYSARLGRVILEPAKSRGNVGCLAQVAQHHPMVLDLTTGELKTSRHRAWLGAGALHGCGRVAGS